MFGSQLASKDSFEASVVLKRPPTSDHPRRYRRIGRHRDCDYSAPLAQRAGNSVGIPDLGLRRADVRTVRRRRGRRRGRRRARAARPHRPTAYVPARTASEASSGYVAASPRTAGLAGERRRHAASSAGGITRSSPTSDVPPRAIRAGEDLAACAHRARRRRAVASARDASRSASAASDDTAHSGRPRRERDALRGRHADAQAGERAGTGADRDRVELARRDPGGAARRVDRDEQVGACGRCVSLTRSSASTRRRRSTIATLAIERRAYRCRGSSSQEEPHDVVAQREDR